MAINYKKKITNTIEFDYLDAKGDENKYLEELGHLYRGAISLQFECNTSYSRPKRFDERLPTASYYIHIRNDLV